ncbi:Inner membrane protein YbhI [Marinomonas gallaica]|uniref:Inner membrane protein YbhI n=1 Tax=Marinomonas gallaica TaxID=1806667 RepID=A0A1C3JP95_9GAMM|nr:SLC13 family permease [Marinomonas gallaica]SBT17041.1 Inner membrane protein YbhI [Marinomonas gallaica]SBT20652.1 Inner membrane protein YbhI [Marinomonas gallaica]
MSVEQNKTEANSFWPVLGITLVSALIAVIGTLFLPSIQAAMLGILILCAALWATSYVPEYWPAVALFGLITVTQIAPGNVVLSGFTSSTFWLLFSGMVFGAAIQFTGLNHKVARLLIQILGRRYRSVIIRTVMFGLFLAFLIPSGIGRVVLLIPIVVAIADQLGYQEGSKGRYGILLAAAFGTFLPSFSILPANAPNMLLSGINEALYGNTLSYWDYLVLHFPVLGLVKALVVIIVILWLFPAQDPSHSVKQPQSKTSEPIFNAKEKQLLLVLIACFCAWFTDSLHHISPGWIGLVACSVLLWPNGGFTSKQCLSKDLNYGPLFFAAGIIGLGATIAFTGLGDSIVNALTHIAPFKEGAHVLNLALVTAISLLVGIIANLSSIPAIITPLAADLADITGLSSYAIVMSEVMAFSTVLLPYQAPPLITAMALGKLPLSIVSKVCLITFVITLFVLLPLNILWWQIVGML